MYKILNEGQGQGLWETLASMTYPQLLLIWLNIPHLLPWFQKIGPNIPTRGNCIGNTTSDPSDNF
jgi:hypothetical protein